MKSNKDQYFIEDLFNIIKKRSKENNAESYTNFLFKKGKKNIAKKLGEETTELIIDYLSGSKKRTIEEAADVLYHLLVLLHSKKINLSDIEKELKKRKNVR